MATLPEGQRTGECAMKKLAVQPFFKAKLPPG